VFNVGGPEVLVILLLALIVLGPSRLPDAARQLGKARAEIRRLSSGFQDEIRHAFDEETTSAAQARTTGTTSGPPAGIEPSGVSAATAAAGPERVAQTSVPTSPEPAPPDKPARRRREPLRAERRPADTPD
jgi:sec-independent protein translocase protein TatB